MKTQYYLINVKYVGPNKTDSSGHYYEDAGIMYIQTVPGTKNMSGEPCHKGWLGTTNDVSQTAHGEFYSLFAAQCEARRLGYTKQRDLDDYEKCLQDENGSIESWVFESDSFEQWDAAEWFDGIGMAATCLEYGITAETTDEQISEIVKNAEKVANENSSELHDTDVFFTALRDELIENAKEKKDRK
jgi:hypothetical protein